MTAPSDPNVHSTISKFRSRIGNLGLGKSKSPSSTSSPSSPPTQEYVEPKLHQGIDYSVNSRNYTIKESLRQLYPAIDPFKTGKLKVDDRHELYWEACGNEKGDPGK